MKLSLALAGAALLAGTLTACGGNSDGGGASGTGGSGSDYCKDLKSAATTYGSLSGSGDTSKLDSAFATFHKLAGEAPGAIKDDWKVLDNAIETIQKALADAGLKFSDLTKIQKGQAPEGYDPSKLAALVPKLTKLNDANFTKASKAVTAHAKNTCHVTLKP